MARTLLRSIAAAAAAAGAFALPLGAHASVQLTGCAGGSFGSECGLDELLAGGTVTVNGYSFSNFTLSLAAGRLLNASAIRIDVIEQPLAPGFTLVDVGNTLRAGNGDLSSNNLSFDIGAAAGNPQLVGGALRMAVGDLSGSASFANAFADLFNPSFTTLLGNLVSNCSAPACANATVASAASFVAANAISVIAGIDVASVAGGLADINSLSVVLTPVPEPATISLLALGLCAVAGRRRGVQTQ